MTAADAERYYRRLRAGDPRHRRAPPPAAASTTGPASRSSSRRCIRATPAPSSSACMAELLPRLQGAGGAGARATTSASTSTPRRPTGWSCRSTCWRRCASSPALAGWNGIGFVVQAYQKRCPFVIDWLIDLARRSGHRLMVRLVKGAYWDSEIKRAQVDGLDGLPGLHPQGPHRRLLPRLRAQAAGRAGRGLPAIRHPQRADARRRPRHGRRRISRRPVRVPVPARHGRAAVRGGGRRATSSTGPAASTRRSARTRPCSPIWCAGCWRTAPTPPSSTASPIRPCRSTTLVADPVDAGARARSRSARRIRRSRCRATCSAPERRNSRRARPRPTSSVWRRSPPRCSASVRHRLAGRPTARDGAGARRSSTRPTGATSSAQWSRRRRTRSTRRSAAPTPPRRLGGDAARRARRLPAARGRPARGADAGAARA